MEPRAVAPLPAAPRVEIARLLLLVILINVVPRERKPAPIALAFGACRACVVLRRLRVKASSMNQHRASGAGDDGRELLLVRRALGHKRRHRGWVGAATEGQRAALGSHQHARHACWEGPSRGCGWVIGALGSLP